MWQDEQRELLKSITLAAAMADALRRRGVPDPDASLAAEVGIVGFRTAFSRWVSAPDQQDLARLIRDSLDQLKVIIAGTGA